MGFEVFMTVCIKKEYSSLYIAADDLKRNVVKPKTAILREVQSDVTGVWNSMSESAGCINLSAVC